jgi:N6-L-threonylcarbamoyladenine synthase
MILGIETSCDETSAAVVDGGRILSNLIASQFEIHTKYGGVVPELASRSHLERLDGLVAEALGVAGIKPADLTGVAVTQGPGLIGCLLIGVTAAKTLAWSWNKPLIGVDHIHAHATSAAMGCADHLWPAVALVVSGGHTSLYHVTDYDCIRRLGRTIDDAAGEAFDKVASILKLGYPGGPVIDQRSRRGNPNRVRFPRSKLDDGTCDFSFSGLKTAVLYHVHGSGRTSGGLERLSASDIDDICASFSAAVVDVLVAKTMTAVVSCGARTVVIGGGVAANTLLRQEMARRCDREGLRLALTPLEYCTDNAAMIAALGEELLKTGARGDLAMGAFASTTVR